ncbi:MAG: HYR domain-containing protein, partial [Bacteroidales bacterium]|nr:HYR domain-containing protein [Bacteroidales bacterium]
MRSFIVLLITVFICGLSVKPAFSDDLYWINGGGYWNNSKHWSLSSGGESCNRIPTKNDNVIFDNNSFTGNGQKIIINDKTFCNDFHWNVTNYEATLKSSFFLFRGITKAEVNIGGNLFINDGYVDDYHGKFNFSSSGRVNLFIEPEINGDINVNCKGKVIVESDIRTYGIVNVIAGELDLNKKEIKTSSFVSSGNNQRKINFNESRIIADEVDFSDTRNLKYIGDKIQIEIPKGYNKREIRIGNLPISILRSGTRAPLAQDSITSTNITCYNQTTGTVTIAISGGTAPYTYSLYRTPELSLISSANFSDTVYTFNNVAAASYVVRVEDSNFGIIQTSPETVSEPARLMAGNITINSGLSCFDGSDAELQAAASGGTPPYTYQWQEDIGGTWTNLTGETSNVLSNIGQGIYQVRVNDQNSCGPVSSQKVFNKAFEPSLVPDSISITGVSSTNTCSGVNLGSITISATGGTGTMSYAIVRTSDSDSTNNSTGVFNNLQADTYRVYAIDANDCAKRESDVTINSLASPTANITPDPANACPGMALALNGNPVLGDGTSFVTHAWTGTGADSLDNTAIQNPNFTNSTAGNYNLTYTVTDDNGCSGSDNIVVAVGDTVVPAVACQNITVQLDTTGNVSITAAQINNGSSDNCTNTADLILTVSPDSFSCADIGPNPVILTVEDASGNSSSCTSTVTVLDRLPPIPSCKNITVNLDSTGTALITPADINDGSFDNCTDIADLILTVSPDSFSCDQIGSRQVILTVQDTSGNTSNCTSTVTVSDMITPVIYCPDDTAVNAQGSCSANVNNLSPLIVDNCGSSLTPTWTMTGATVGTGTVDVSGSTFSGGSTEVTYTVTDGGNNTHSCSFYVTVNDTIPPVPGCKNITVYLDSTGTALITPADINDGSSD